MLKSFQIDDTNGFDDRMITPFIERLTSIGLEGKDIDLASSSMKIISSVSNGASASTWMFLYAIRCIPAKSFGKTILC